MSTSTTNSNQSTTSVMFTSILILADIIFSIISVTRDSSVFAGAVAILQFFALVLASYIGVSMAVFDNICNNNELDSQLASYAKSILTALEIALLFVFVTVAYAILNVSTFSVITCVIQLASMFSVMITFAVLPEEDSKKAGNEEKR